ncbi:hypothetical protein GIB67_010302, partial [Kingdonia uniflora]
MISVLANTYDRDVKLLNGTHKSHVHSHQEAEILAKYKPVINATLLIPILKQVEDTTTKALEYFKSTRHINLYYEDLINNPSKLMDVQEFLRIPQRDLYSRQVKIHKGSLSEQVQNWEDILEMLKGSQFESFLHEDYILYRVLLSSSCDPFAGMLLKMTLLLRMKFSSFDLFDLESRSRLKPIENYDRKTDGDKNNNGEKECDVGKSLKGEKNNNGEKSSVEQAQSTQATYADNLRRAKETHVLLEDIPGPVMKKEHYKYTIIGRLPQLEINLQENRPQAISKWKLKEAGVVTKDSKKFDRDGLEMKHLEETTEREVHRAIDLVGRKDGDMLESSRSKDNEEVVTLMREVHMINDSNRQETQPKKTNPNSKALPRIQQTIEEELNSLQLTKERSPAKIGKSFERVEDNLGLRHIANSNLVVTQHRFHAIDWGKPSIFDESPDEGHGDPEKATTTEQAAVTPQVKDDGFVKPKRRTDMNYSVGKWHRWIAVYPTLKKLVDDMGFADFCSINAGNSDNRLIHALVER